MSDIKMSDAFGRGKCLNIHWGDKDCFTRISSERMNEYAEMAINAYDANQELIERYRKLVCQTCDGHGAVGNILDSMDCPDCTLAANAQGEEIKALKAMVNEFIEEFSCFVAQHECNCGHPSCRTCKECKDAFKLLDKTPQHCLDDVRASVIKDFGRWCLKHHKMKLCSDLFLDQLRSNHEKPEQIN